MKCPKCQTIVHIREGQVIGDQIYSTHFANNTDPRPCETSGKQVGSWHPPKPADPVAAVDEVKP